MAAFHLKQKIAKINDPNNSIDEDLDESLVSSSSVSD